MKITINTDVLHEENLSLGDFLALLIGDNDIDYEDSFYRMIETELAAPNVFHEESLILSYKKIRPEMGRINSYEIYSENYSALASSAFASSAAGASTGASALGAALRLRRVFLAAAFGVLAMFSS